MARTNRFDADSVERRGYLARRGNLPNRSGSRRSDRIRSIAENMLEELSLVAGDDDMDIDPNNVRILCDHDYDCDCDLIALEACFDG